MLTSSERRERKNKIKRRSVIYADFFIGVFENSTKFVEKYYYKIYLKSGLINLQN